MKERLVVLDASAVVAWAQHERPGWETIDKLLDVAIVPASALTESLYRLQQLGHRLSLQDMRQALLDLGVRVEPFTDQDTVRAAELIFASRRESSMSSLSLGDGMCLAVAERLQLTVTGGDQHWATCDLTVDFLPFR